MSIIFGESEFYVDPDEDEVFFAEVATAAQLEIMAKRRAMDVLINQPKATEGKENLPLNITGNSKSYSSLKKNINMSSKCNSPFKNISNCDVFDKKIDDSVEQVPKSNNFYPKNGELCFDNDFADLDNNDDSIDTFYKDCVVNESLVSWTSVDVNAQMDSLTKNLNDVLIDESDEEEYNHPVMSYFCSSTPSKTMRQRDEILRTPLSELKADPDGGYLSALHETALAVAEAVKKRQPLAIAPNIPLLMVTESTPELKKQPETPAGSSWKSNEVTHPVRLVYKDEDIKVSKEKIAEGSSSSGSGSYQSFNTPHTTPFAKPTIANIPRTGKRKDTTLHNNRAGLPKALTDQKTRITERTTNTRAVLSGSKIPTFCSAKPTKTLAAKSLQFSNENITQSRLPRLVRESVRAPK